ncbi:hypothetical protein C8J57DRAFT_1234205 [Mycena rebaudengoi]|nr:hypothetical protein C8J57DRAFT_1234205 [Mycena rebaudengoi]
MGTGVSSLFLCALLAAVRVRAQCPNNGIGVGVIGLCQGADPNSGGSYDYAAFITWLSELTNTFSQPVAVNRPSYSRDERASLEGTTNPCSQGYTGGAFVTCSGNTITGVNPPGKGRTPCSSVNIVKTFFEGIIDLYACCHL